jgi:lipid A 3-O-deacylase
MQCSVLPLLIIMTMLNLASLPAHAALEKKAEREKAVQQSFSPRPKSAKIAIESDSMAGDADKSYIHGVRVSLTQKRTEDLPLPAKSLDALMPFFEADGNSALYYSLGHNIFTPRDIMQREADPNDRPWASFLYGTAGLITRTGRHADRAEATIGVVGPMALGETAQRLVYRKMTDRPEGEGWSHQLKNEPGLMLSWERSWPRFALGKIDTNYWSLKPYAGLSAGNIKTHAAAGFTVSFSSDLSALEDSRIDLRPGLSGAALTEESRNKLHWSFFYGVEGRAIARDIFLDGNTFTESHSVEKKNLVAEAASGLSLSYNKLKLGYSAVYRTREFEQQDSAEIYGALNIAVKF